MIFNSTPSKPPTALAAALQSQRPLYVKAIFYSVIINLLILAPTFFMLEVYDRVVNSRNSTTLLMLVILVIGAYIVMELLELVRTGLMHEAALAVDAQLRSNLFEGTFQAKLLGAPGLPTQPFVDLKGVTEFLYSPALMAMMDAPASVLFLILVFIISPWLGALALIGALIQLALAVRTENRTMPVLTEANRAAIESQNYANATLRNAQVIEAMGMMGHLHKRWSAIQVKFLRMQALASDHNGVNTAAGRFVQTMQGSVLLGAAAWLSLKGGMLGGGGMMIVASTLGARILAPLTQLVAQWRLVVNARDSYTRLNAALSAMKERPEGMPLPPPRGQLSVEGVVAGAPGGNVPILRNVSFALAAGETLVVVGPSAAGKTTLARLLVGVWPAASGKVRLDGVDVFAWNKQELGPYVGYLPQSVELFDGTIAENIARFGDIDPDGVRMAAESVGLGAFIASLPDRYDSRIGDDGAFLSGGQRQRVGLARAIYGQPKFVVLDEPNSSLDEAGEACLLDTLKQLKAAGTTVVINSHRTSVLPAADKMLVLKDGQVAAFGPRDEVLTAMQKASDEAKRPRIAAQPSLVGSAA